MQDKGFIIGEETGCAYKVARTVLNLRLKDIEHATFLSKSTICHIEHGTFPISGTALYALWCYYMTFIDMAQNTILCEAMKEIRDKLEILRGTKA